VDEKVVLRAECDKISSEKKILQERVAELEKQLKGSKKK
jgi:hypothetical protein